MEINPLAIDPQSLLNRVSFRSGVKYHMNAERDITPCDLKQ